MQLLPDGVELNGRMFCCYHSNCEAKADTALNQEIESDKAMSTTTSRSRETRELFLRDVDIICPLNVFHAFKSFIPRGYLHLTLARARYYLW